MRHDFQGYHRDTQVRDLLINVISQVLAKHPSMRLGQLIVCAMPTAQGPDLFNIHDEELIERLLTRYRP